MLVCLVQCISGAMDALLSLRAEHEMLFGSFRPQPPSPAPEELAIARHPLIIERVDVPTRISPVAGGFPRCASNASTRAETSSERTAASSAEITNSNPTAVSSGVGTGSSSAARSTCAAADQASDASARPESLNYRRRVASTLRLFVGAAHASVLAHAHVAPPT